MTSRHSYTSFRSYQHERRARTLRPLVVGLALGSALACSGEGEQGEAVAGVSANPAPSAPAGSEPTPGSSQAPGTDGSQTPGTGTGESSGGAPSTPPNMAGAPALPAGEGGGANVGGSAEPGGMAGATNGTGGAPPAGGCKGAGALFAEFTDTSCIDGKYCEALPDISKDISAKIDELRAATELGEVTRLTLEILDETYPFGAKMLREDPTCHDDFAKDFANSDVLSASFGASIHECGHSFDFNGEMTYKIAENVTTSHPKSVYFARNEIAEDRFHNQIPDALANGGYLGADSLTGDQGYTRFLTEWVQYNHNLAVLYLLSRYGLGDYTVELALNFAWAAPRYLLVGKEKHPDDFQAMLQDPGLRETTLVLWGQTWLYYDALVNNAMWVPEAKKTRYVDAIREPALLEIMNELRQAEGCEGR